MHYHVLSKLSEGGFSEVFEVRDPASALDEVLVLKRLSREMSRRPDVRSAFTREGEILAELRHPNVVTFRRCYFEGDHICLVMEKVAGQPLDVWLREGRPDSETVLDAFRQIVEAVDHLHHRPRPLLHLDLKPENVLMRPNAETGTSRPVLIDFGIARDLGGGGLKAYTPPYAAPEQVHGGRLGCYTDVHALGQILAELLAHLSGAPAAETWKGLEAVSVQAREPSPRRRYADAGEMLRAFRRARHADRTLPGSAPLRAWSRQAIHSRRWIPWAAAGCGVAGALLWGLFLLPPEAGTGHETPAPEAPGAGEQSPPSKAAERAPRSAGCWHWTPATADATATFDRFDRCAEMALGSTSQQQMEDQYQAAARFVRDQSETMDSESRRRLQERFDRFHRQVGLRIRASR